MSLPAIVLVLMLVLLVAALVRYSVHSAGIFAAMLLAMLALGFIDTSMLLRNAANPGLATLVLLVLISFSLEKTSLLRRLSRFLFTRSVSGSVLRTIGFSALASSVLNNTAVVAAMLNAVRSNKKVAPTKLLIPLSYAAIMGGTLTLIGTSTNLIVNSMLVEAGEPGFAFFDFTLVGLGVLAGGSLVLFVMSYLLPDEKNQDVVVTEYLLEAKLNIDSPLIGQSVEQAGLRHLDELFLTEIVRDSEVIRPVARYDILKAGDKLIFTGNVHKVNVLKQFAGISLFADENGLATQNLTEVIIKEESVLKGKTLKSSGFRARFDAAVVAVRREGERVNGKLGEIELKAGDFLLLATGPDFASRHNISKNFYLLSGIEPEHMLSGWRERLTWWGFVAMIAGTVFSGTSLLLAAIYLLAALLFSGCLTINEIKRRFPVEIWLIVSSALCIASAMNHTGLAQNISDFAGSALAGQAPMVTFIGIFLLTYLLTEVITNNAAAALMFPVAYSLAKGMGVDIMPMVMGVAFAASASFVTPYGYQTNLMVFNASNYKLKHFVLVGAPVALTYIILSVLLIPLVFPF
ncbi:MULTISPECIES: SLC13 family permease [unclassified Arsukibacterium]|uniref:SLC13 family permease n=1 Tax=unclassified Arsukibacterium TaxID=2635278 RepID=UPI0025B87BDC|nr:MULTISPECIES: SLC13 family permease [unclassified Arsukibacterium]|tara:strand:+ start:47566 stop:49293 length:1728 start_codon:yes stop_codon:yes gene_type:complete